MKTFYFNRQTLLSEPKTPVSLAVEVSEDFTISKVVQRFDKLVHRENEFGEKLFYKEIFKEVITENIIGYDETIYVTDTPIIITSQRRDENDNPLYMENIYDSEGVVIDRFVTTKFMSELGEYNEPIMDEVPKLSESGKPLYLKPIIEEVSSSVLDKIDVTSENTDNPVMDEAYKDVTINIDESPSEFSAFDVLGKKYSNMLEASNYDYIVADMFLDENDIDQDKSFANTGVGIVNLPPRGYLTTKSISLEQPAKNIKVANFDELPNGVRMFINDTVVIGGNVHLKEPMNIIVIKYLNKSNKAVELSSFVLFYSKEVI